MKLAIARGYQYFGYDPDTYFDLSVEKAQNTVSVDSNGGVSNVRKIGRNEDDGAVEQFNDGKSVAVKAVNIGHSSVQYNEGSTPPKLPRPLSLVNCIQARTVLARLLRFQQGGNNPMYGSPETEPPWWPNDLIRWVDMVDLRYVCTIIPHTFKVIFNQIINV